MKPRHVFGGVACLLALVLVLCSTSALADEDSPESQGAGHLYFPIVSRANGSWVAAWNSTEEVVQNWIATGERCFRVPQPHVLELTCQSGAIFSKQYFDTTKNITASVTVSAGPGANSSSNRFWGGIALLVEDDPNPKYVELAVERNIAPYDYNRADDQAYIVHLSTPGASRCCDRFLLADPDKTYAFTIRYDPAGVVYYYVNNLLVSTIQVKLVGNARIDLLCVAVSPGETEPNARSHCVFGILNVDAKPAMGP